MSFSEFDIKLAMRMAVASVVLLLCGTVRAETDLDDVTMRVIGLDEIPTHSLQIIELPQSDLGELSDINESLVTGTSEQPVLPSEDMADTIAPISPPGGEVSAESP